MRFANSPAATIFLLVLLATGGVASAQFHGAGGGEQPAEPTESAEAEKPKTGAFTADWPLPPAAQIDAELRQYMARYDGALRRRNRRPPPRDSSRPAGRAEPTALPPSTTP